MSEPAERIQPEQDYADRAAEAIGKLNCYPQEAEDKRAAEIIRSTLREEATERWGMFRKGELVATSKGEPGLWETRVRAGYTVRRVLVLEQGEDK